MSRTDLTNPRDRLPEIRLPRAPGGSAEGLRPPGRKRPIVALLHGSACERCVRWAEALDAKRIAAAGGVVRIVVPTDSGDAVRLTPAGAVALEDPAGSVARALGTPPPSVIVADEWGEVHERFAGGEEHELPPNRALLEWLDHLAVRCPECEGEAY